MRSNFKFIVLALPVLAALWLGCQSKTVPVGVYAPPGNGFPDYTLVSNFDGNLNPTPEPGNFINAHLLEAGVTGNIVKEPGVWLAINNFTNNEACTMTIMGPGANGTANACHMTGYLTDNADGSYPSAAIMGFPDISYPPPYKGYHADYFKGVKFYLNITPQDTAIDRYFYIQTTQEQVPPVGTCTAGKQCYNYFGHTYTAPTNGWQLQTFDFTQLAPGPYGFQPTPLTLTGVNLEQIIGLEFAESMQNSKGTANLDLWFDEIYFYQ